MKYQQLFGLFSWFLHHQQILQNSLVQWWPSFQADMPQVQLWFPSTTLIPTPTEMFLIQFAFWGAGIEAGGLNFQLHSEEGQNTAVREIPSQKSRLTLPQPSCHHSFIWQARKQSLECSSGCRAREDLAWLLVVTHPLQQHPGPTLLHTARSLSSPASLMVPCFTEHPGHTQQLLWSQQHKTLSVQKGGVVERQLNICRRAEILSAIF